MGVQTPKENSLRMSVKASSKSIPHPKSPASSTNGHVVQDKNKGKKMTTPEPVPPPEANAVINGEEIQKLAIKEEELAKLRENFPSSVSTSAGSKKMYTLKRSAPTQNQTTKPRQRLVVAKPAPADAIIKPIDYSGPAGPSYTADGQIVEHSLLGTVADFVDEALRRGDMLPQSPAVGSRAATTAERKLEVREYKRTASTRNKNIPTAMNQENALQNWRRKMIERKKQLGHISTLLQKPYDRLVMNQDIKYREVQETRQVVDRSIAAVDYGKGYRVGSEFWRQHESFGDDLTGIKMTLTKTEKGEPIDFEHIGKPQSVKYETGASSLNERGTADPGRTWHSSQYLKRRTKQLQPIMAELDPYNPDLASLELVGTKGSSNTASALGYSATPVKSTITITQQGDEENADPLASYPDNVPEEPIVGPALIFGGVPCQWNGSSDSDAGKLGAATRVTFDTPIDTRQSSHLKLVNNGTTAVYYDWRKIQKPPCFKALRPDPKHRFYFNTGEGVILPGDVTEIPFIFKSPNAGIFTESWEFITKPALMGGASLQVTLKGVATQSDTLQDDRLKIDAELAAREARDNVDKIIDDLIRGIRTPERPSSPIDAYITEEEIFNSKNAGYIYDYEIVQELKGIYLQLFGEDDREGREWNLSLDSLRTCVAAIEDEDAREELLIGLNNVINRLCMPPITATQMEKYNSAYNLWQETLDNIAGVSMMLRNIMGLPEHIMAEMPSEPEPLISSAVSVTSSSMSLQSSSVIKSARRRSSVASRGASGASSAGKEDKKGGKGGKKGGKDAKEEKGKKGGKGKEKEERPKSKAGKKATTPGKQASGSPSKDLLSVTDRDTASRAPSSAKSAAVKDKTDTLDPVTRRKYTEKIHSEVYGLLLEMVDRMTASFEDINQSGTMANSLLETPRKSIYYT